jgi:hypothetical protein
MFLDAELHTAYKIGNTPILNFPFPHFYVENIFPDDFYSKIQENLLDTNEMMSMAEVYSKNKGLEGYKDRFIIDFKMEESLQKIEKDKFKFWESFQNNFSLNFSNLLQSKFKRFLDMRFQYLENVSFRHEVRLINDKKNYALGPHTDQPAKVISVLFYLPKDLKQKETGTSIYMPKDPNKLNKKLPHVHYPHENFNKVTTIPFVPNSAFCFIKTNNSFHGVEKLEMEDTDRWSLQYNMYVTQETLEDEIAAKNKHLNENKT